MKIIRLRSSSHESGRLRHVDIAYFFCKEQIEKRSLDVVKINSENQEADFLTKPLEKKLFDRCCERILGQLT